MMTSKREEKNMLLRERGRERERGRDRERDRETERETETEREGGREGGRERHTHTCYHSNTNEWHHIIASSTTTDAPLIIPDSGMRIRERDPVSHQVGVVRRVIQIKKPHATMGSGTIKNTRGTRKGRVIIYYT